MNKETQLLSISLAVYAVFILAEIAIGFFQRKKNYSLKDSSISIWFAILGGIFDILMKATCFYILDFFNQHAIFKPDLISFYPIWAWMLVFISQDFFFYWLHRAEHSIRLLWAVHSNHHSSEHFNFTVALRSSVFQPFYRYMFYIPIALMGFDGLTIMFVYAINQIYQFFLHTEIVGKIPIWNKIFVTPSHHRVHHASNEVYLDKNMGQVLIIWDRIFGTFQEELEYEKPKYGLTKNINTFNPIKALLLEFIRLFKDISATKSLRTKINYLIQSPDWKPKKYGKHTASRNPSPRSQ